MTSTTLAPTSAPSVSTLPLICLEGNQYTYEGNKHQHTTSHPAAVQECIDTTILNQEIGKCPIEYTSGVSRAKVYDMKQLKPKENVRSFNALYNDSLVLSSHHELQRFGKRSEGLSKGAANSKTIQRATYINRQEESPAKPQTQAVPDKTSTEFDGTAPEATEEAAHTDEGAHTDEAAPITEPVAASETVTAEPVAATEEATETPAPETAGQDPAPEQ